MMIKRIAVFLTFMFFIAAAYGQPVPVEKSVEKITENGMVFYLHKVVAGQTLYSISKVYNVDQEDIIKYNPDILTAGLLAGNKIKIPDTAKSVSVAEPVVKYTHQPDTNGFLTHIVVAGETFFGIARKYNLTTVEVLNANPEILDTESLSVGQKIRIPMQVVVGDPVTEVVQEIDTVIIHTVQRGESLYGIARQYKTSTDSIISWNPEFLTTPIKRGDEVRILVRMKKPVTVIEPPKTQYDTILHQIQDNETMWGLARKYNTTVSKILELNPELEDGLKQGYFIYIPVPATVKPVTDKDVPGVGCEYSRFRSKYKVALMMPLYLDEIDMIHIPTAGYDDKVRKPFFKPFSFVEFYQGVIIAVDSLRRVGLSVDLYVYDTANDSNKVKLILAKPEMEFVDMIIGPFFTDNYNIVSRFAERNNIKLISPFARNRELLHNYSNVFQMNAFGETKFRELANHISAAYHEPNILMVISNSEEDKILAGAFKEQLDANFTIQAHRPHYVQQIYTEGGVAGVSRRLDATKHNIIVNLITGESMVSNYVSNIAKMTDNFEVTMFGIPEWKNYRTFDLADLINVNMHLFDNNFVDYRDPATKIFLKEFRRRYHGDPDETNYAFFGYDIGLYFLQALHEFGLDFENCIDRIELMPTSAGFSWRQINGKGYENTWLNLYRYDGFDLKRVNTF